MSAKLWLSKHPEMHGIDKKNMDEILFGKVYYKLRQGIITNCDSSLYYKLRQGLLQIATGTLLQIATSFITNCGRYYKLRRLLLQTATGITSCDSTPSIELYQKPTTLTY